MEHASPDAGPTDDAVLDRYRGCLLGVALGDALGAPYEFSTPPFEVGRQFRRGVFGTAPGHPTDDSTLAVACAEALLEAGGSGDAGDGAGGFQDRFAAGYVRRLVAWAASGPPDIGSQTARAAAAWRAGHPPEDDEVAQGNGSLMAVAPVGLRFAPDPDMARATASAFARLTHPSPAAAECNAVYVDLVAAAVRGEWRGTDGTTPALAAAGIDPAGAHQGWCRLTLHLAVGALADAASVGPFDAVLRLVARGGDADTNAAVAGGLLGAVHGAGAWPVRLLDGLALRDRMTELATALWRAARTP